MGAALKIQKQMVFSVLTDNMQGQLVSSPDHQSTQNRRTDSLNP